MTMTASKKIIVAEQLSRHQVKVLGRYDENERDLAYEIARDLVRRSKNPILVLFKIKDSKPRILRKFTKSWTGKVNEK